jgi:RNA polymerase sigma-70 factor (ECF subfamily)
VSSLRIGKESLDDPEWAGPESMKAWSGGWPQSLREFEAFVDAYLDRLVRYAVRRLGNVHDAEDVVQEVFIRAYSHRDRLRAVTRPGSYLYRMVTNACADFLRKRRVRAASLEGVERGQSYVAERVPSEAAMLSEESSRAEELLRLLPEDQAEVIRLRVFGELRLNEIAETLGCPVNTVSSRLRYGFKKLRRIVSEKRG